MSQILNEVRAISSQKIAEKQKASEDGYPKILEKIKDAASKGVTHCELPEYVIDQYSKRLLEQDGFTVYATTRSVDSDIYAYLNKKTPERCWIVGW